ncbi:hypothetical protein BU14_1160s0003 [Porphyra umbilicalis]|uniref:Uncharacterized protein n=1 Tax=Porphyra umbilicalis TaxID=2786 RepID=A0A1X6NMB9_PORUM|nr:hypothetical protein BU14_1160s0003 [Porphyra umbilicalis]|eukprot:OSX69781.1 hypothetical protein BU14_1160s0003 [Porphyra umbilicalis]
MVAAVPAAAPVIMFPPSRSAQPLSHTGWRQQTAPSRGPTPRCRALHAIRCHTGPAVPPRGAPREHGRASTPVWDTPRRGRRPPRCARQPRPRTAPPPPLPPPRHACHTRVPVSCQGGAAARALDRLAARDRAPSGGHRAGDAAADHATQPKDPPSAH